MLQMLTIVKVVCVHFLGNTIANGVAAHLTATPTEIQVVDFFSAPGFKVIVLQAWDLGGRRGFKFGNLDKLRL